jgi:hypothetical protein
MLCLRIKTKTNNNDMQANYLQASVILINYLYNVVEKDIDVLLNGAIHPCDLKIHT